jgi:hypothetical protein
MGVVSKRRDNAPILKHTFNGVVDTIMKERDVGRAIEFVRATCRDMVDGKYDLNMFVISKTLNSYYKDPESIAHKVLADRMAERDAGTKPAVNERIPYVFIKIEEKRGCEYLQGDRIEHVNYVRSNGCPIDYEKYILNQIMKPVAQIFELIVEKLPKYPYGRNYMNDLEIEYYNKFDGDLDKVCRKMNDIKLQLVQKLIFDDLIRYAEAKYLKLNTLDKWCVRVEDDGSDIVDKVEVVAISEKKKLKQTTMLGWIKK